MAIDSLSGCPAYHNISTLSLRLILLIQSHAESQLPVIEFVSVVATVTAAAGIAAATGTCHGTHIPHRTSNLFTFQ